MKKYLGAHMTIYVYVCLIVFIVISFVAFIFIVLESHSFFSVYFAILCLLCVLFGTLLIIKAWDQVFSWGFFDEDRVTVKRLFKKTYTIEYSKCKDVSVAYYINGISKFNPKVVYIYFSYNIIDEKYKSHINLIHPSNTFIKVGFSKKLYRYLLMTLPDELAEELERSVNQATEL